MIGVPYTPEVDPTIAAEAFANGLRANLIANGGVGGGNLALTTQIVLQTTDGKVQLGSADDGNEVTFYADGADFAAGTVKTRVFLKKGEVYVETGLTAGAVITSTKGVCGASGNDGGGQSPMPLGVEGFAGRQFFMYAQRNASGGTGANRGEVYVAAGAVSATVSLYNGAGDTIVDGPVTLDPFSLTTLLTNANDEFQIIADQPVFVGFAAAMNVGSPFCYDMRLVPPLTTNLIGHARSCRLSALYANTEVFMYAQDGSICLVTVSPGSPVNVGGGSTYNELGDVFFLESNATPATAGNFRLITVDPSATIDLVYQPNTTGAAMDTAIDAANKIIACIFTMPASFPSTNREVLWESGGSAAGVGIYLNTSGQLEVYSNGGSAEGSPRVATTALSASTQYGCILELDSIGVTVKLHIVASSDLSFWSSGRTPEYSYTPPSTDYCGSDGTGYGLVNVAAGGISGTPTIDPFSGVLNSNLVILNNTVNNIFNVTGNIAFDASPQDVVDALHAIAGNNSATGVTATATSGVSPVSIASTAHGLSNGDSVTITSSTDTTRLALGHYSNVNVVDSNTFEIDFYPTTSGTTTVDWNDTIFGDNDFKIESVKQANLGESSAKFVVYCKGLLSRKLALPTIDAAGLTGNAHTATVYQLGTAVNTLPVPTDYAKEGVINAVASGPISGFSGADGAGLEATYWFPVSALTQRIPIPLAFSGGAGNGDQRSIAVMSPYKGSAKLFRANGDLLMSFMFDRGAALATPDSSFEQRFPTGWTVSGNAAGAGIDQAFSGDWLGGYIEADVPINLVLNTNSNEDLIQQGIPTSSDEIICFGVTPESSRARIVTTTSGRQRKQTVDENGTETWELV